MNRQIEKLFLKYLAGTAAADEKRALNDWIISNPDLKQWIEQEVNTMPKNMNNPQQEELLKKIHIQIQKKETSRKLVISRLKSVAAVILILLALGSVISIITYGKRLEKQYTVVEAMRGQKTNVTLPDGTKVILNSDTKLSYNNSYNLKSRTVILSGEAFFEVANDKSIPFFVQAGKISVQAIGTTFNVRAYQDEEHISTTLMEGNVNIHTPSEVIGLLPDERMEYNTVNNSIAKTGLSENARASVGWLNDKLSFENATLAEVAAELSRCYNVDIVFENDDIKQQRFSGKISNNSLETVLRILSLTSPIQYKMKDNTIEIYETSPDKK